MDKQDQDYREEFIQRFSSKSDALTAVRAIISQLYQLDIPDDYAEEEIELMLEYWWRVFPETDTSKSVVDDDTSFDIECELNKITNKN